MYYICKLSDTWSVLDTDNHTSKPLNQNGIDFIKENLPKLLSDKLVTFMEVRLVNPKQLLQIIQPEKANKKSKSDKVVNT